MITTCRVPRLFVYQVVTSQSSFPAQNVYLSMAFQLICHSSSRHLDLSRIAQLSLLFHLAVASSKSSSF